MELFFVAGEPSGDGHAAEVIKEVRARVPQLQVRGLGGQAMAAAGCEVQEDLAADAIMGLWPVLRALPRMRRTFLRTVEDLRARPPAALVLVDYPGFNLRLAARAKRLGIPVIYYISPQIWAWAPWRLRLIRRLVDLMLVILPFEADLYERAGVPVRHVGHPLADHRERHPVDPATVAEIRGSGGPLLALLPGSRRHVVQSLAPIFGRVATALRARPGLEDLRLTLALARPDFEALVRPHLPAGIPCDLRQGRAREVITAADACLTTSGTTTLEITGAGTPFALGYKVSAPFYFLARTLITVEHIGLVNLVAGRRVVPEFVSFRDFAPQAAEALAPLLTDREAREAMQRDLAAVREKLGGPGSFARTAEEILAFVRERADA